MKKLLIPLALLVVVIAALFLNGDALSRVAGAPAAPIAEAPEQDVAAPEENAAAPEPNIASSQQEAASQQEDAASADESEAERIFAEFQPGVPAFLVQDVGRFSGQTNVRILDLPQLLLWQPASSYPVWAAYTGIPSGLMMDSENGRAYVLDQTKVGVADLRDITFRYDDPYPPSSEWPLSLTVLDLSDGSVLSRAELPRAPIYGNGGSLIPFGVSDGLLYFYHSSLGQNLAAFDFESGQFLETTWRLCESGGYPMTPILSPDGAHVYVLCTNFSTGLVTYLAALDLSAGVLTRVDMPEEFESEDGWIGGNGLALSPDGSTLYVVDSDLGLVAEVNAASLRITRTLSYLPKPKDASLFESILARLGDLFVRSAAAKRYWALTAVSPDGRWLAVDSSYMNEQEKPAVWVFDLQTFQVARQIELAERANVLAFDNGGTLYALLQKVFDSKDSTIVVVNLATGVQTSVEVYVGRNPITIQYIP